MTKGKDEKLQKKKAATSPRVTRRTREQRVIGGRGRAGNSTLASPVVGAQLVEDPISLSEIPTRAGPPVKEKRNLHADFVDGEEEDDDELIPVETPEEDLEKRIEEEENRLRRLQKEKRLAELKNENLKLRNDISTVHVEYDRELDRRQQVNEQRIGEARLESVRASSAELFASVAASQGLQSGQRIQAPGASRPVREVASLGQLPTLNQVQDEVVIPTLSQLRARQDLQGSVDQYINDTGLLESGRGAGNLSNSSNLTSGRGAKGETGVLRPVVWPHTR